MSGARAFLVIFSKASPAYRAQHQASVTWHGQTDDVRSGVGAALTVASARSLLIKLMQVLVLATWTQAASESSIMQSDMLERGT